jgi:biopolymer transport protein ExbB
MKQFPLRPLLPALMLLLVVLPAMLLLQHRAASQEPASPSAGPPPSAPAADAGADASAEDTPASPARTPGASSTEGISLFRLCMDTGWWMLPMIVMLLIVITFAVERGLALRRSRVIPSELIEGLGQLGNRPGGFDPRQAYKLCQQYPSAASTVIRAMLLKVGRPHSEVEHAVAESSQREAERLYSNVRWLTLHAGIAPLYGLAGTVWGIIVAFHQMTILQANQNKAELMAQGIYTALVTTLGGLIIAIPAAIIAHWYEGRIQMLFHQIDDLLFNLLPQIERYEGRVRFGRQAGDSEPPPPAEEASTLESDAVASTPK